MTDLGVTARDRADSQEVVTDVWFDALLLPFNVGPPPASARRRTRFLSAPSTEPFVSASFATRSPAAMADFFFLSWLAC